MSFTFSRLWEHKYISSSHAIRAEPEYKRRNISSCTHTNTHTRNCSNIKSISPSSYDYNTKKALILFFSFFFTGWVLLFCVHYFQTSQVVMKNHIFVPSVWVSDYSHHLRKYVSCPAHSPESFTLLFSKWCIWISFRSISILDVFPSYWQGGQS